MYKQYDSTRQDLRIWQPIVSGLGFTVVDENKNLAHFCTDNSVGHAVRYIRIPAWTEIRSGVTSNYVPLQKFLDKPCSKPGILFSCFFLFFFFYGMLGWRGDGD